MADKKAKSDTKDKDKKRKDRKKSAQTDNDANTDIVTMIMGAFIGGNEEKSPSKKAEADDDDDKKADPRDPRAGGRRLPRKPPVSPHLDKRAQKGAKEREVQAPPAPTQQKVPGRKSDEAAKDGKGKEVPKDEKSKEVPKDDKGKEAPKDDKGKEVPKDDKGKEVPKDVKGEEVPQAVKQKIPVETDVNKEKFGALKPKDGQPQPESPAEKAPSKKVEIKQEKLKVPSIRTKTIKQELRQSPSKKAEKIEQHIPVKPELDKDKKAEIKQELRPSPREKAETIKREIPVTPDVDKDKKAEIKQELRPSPREKAETIKREIPVEPDLDKVKKPPATEQQKPSIKPDKDLAKEAVREEIGAVKRESPAKPDLKKEMLGAMKPDGKIEEEPPIATSVKSSPKEPKQETDNIDDDVLIYSSGCDEEKSPTQGPTIKRQTPSVKPDFDMDYADKIKHYVKRETPAKPNLDKEWIGALKVKQQKRTTLPEHLSKDRKMYKKRVTLSYSHLAVPWHKKTQQDSEEKISSLKDPDDVNWGLGRRLALQQIIQSQHVKPLRFVYKQFYRGRCWDAVICNDVVHAVLFNTTRRRLILIKQFRPPVYFEAIRALRAKQPKIGEVLEIYDMPASLGVTLELCMGVMNKYDATPIEAIRRKIYYDCGYSVPLTRLEKVQWCLNNSRNSAEKSTLFYAEVTDKMRVEDTPDMIEIRRRKEVNEMSIKEAKNFVKGDKAILMTTYSTLYGIMWFLYVKAPTISHKSRSTSKRLLEQVSSFFGKVGKFLGGKS